MTVEIRHLATPEEFALAEELQRLVWGGDEAPAHVMMTAAHNGGICAGAFMGDALVGFVWGFLGFDQRIDPPRLKHCSHQLGVHPAHRNFGLGFRLKRFQWEFVRGQGLELMTWTYDPLLAANASLNIARLGAVCSLYRRNEYGELDDDLNAGLPTDRFQVDLWVNSPRVCRAMTGEPHSAEGHEPLSGINLPLPGKVVQPPTPEVLSSLRDAAERVAVGIPADFQSLRASDGRLAAEWRFATRVTFESLFARGYQVVDFEHRDHFGCYILSREVYQ
jgi:predicted GNAT superfamily acetyltransferase